MFDPMKLISDEFEETIFKAIARYSKEYKTEQKNIRVCFSLNDKGGNAYHIYVNEGGKSKLMGEVTFKQMIGVKIDFLQKEKKVPPIVQATLLMMNDENGMEDFSARMMMSKIIDPKTSGNKLYMYLYNKDKPVKEVTFEDIIDLIQKAAAHAIN